MAALNEVEDGVQNAAWHLIATEGDGLELAVMIRP